MKYEWLIASRYLRSRRKQSFISIISVISVGGVALGIATVILVISALNGFEQGLKDKFLANEAHVTVRSVEPYFGDYQKSVESIEAIEGVVAASPVIYTQLAVWPKGSRTIEGTIYVKGIDPQQEDRVTRFSDYVDEPVDFQTSPILEKARRDAEATGETIFGGIILGSEIANRLRVFNGDIVRLISEMQQHPADPNMFIPRIRNFVLIGIYSSGLYTFDNAFGFIDLQAAQKLYKKEDQINMIQVRIESADRATETQNQIVSKIRFKEGIGGTPMTRTWMEDRAPLFEAMKLERTVTGIIEALIILVAAFNIASTLIMMVMEKIRDVGILRAMGASKQGIRKIFMFQGSLIGLLGAIFGTTLGLSLSWLLDLQTVRPSRWFALAVLLPVGIQMVIALRRVAPLHVSLKGIVTLCWLAAAGLALYCLAQPIYIDSQIYQLNRLPFKINWFFVGFMNVLSFAICWLASVYPAWQASNLNPVEALRYE